MSRLQSAYKDPFIHPPHDLIPELILLGTLSKEEQFHDNGTCIEMDIITYEGKKYVMKMGKITRWYEERRA